MKKGFSLIEMLVVIGIIVTLTAMTITGYARLGRSAENARARELVSNVATALGALYQQDGMWPKRIAAASAGDNLLDEDTAIVLAKKGVMALDNDGAKLKGYDRFGIVTPWAVSTIKAGGTKVTKSTLVGQSRKTIADHTLRVAVDVDGEGFTELPEIEGMTGSRKVRATVCVWCCSQTGSFKYKDLVKSWSDGQVVR